jgi:hypothetical protein
MTMKITGLGIVLAAAALAVFVAPAAASADTSAPPIPQQPLSAQSGSVDSAGTAVPYQPSAGSAAPDAYSAYCSLSVAMWSTHPPATGDTLTLCNWPVDTISHVADLYRLRWYGWEGLNQNSKINHGHNSLAMEVTWGCKGVGTYTYEVDGYGNVEWDGDDSSAAAYDRNRFNC